MKPKSQERGQALILIAFAAIGLFAFTALAIDGSRVFSDRRHAQNAADTAALAAALAKSEPTPPRQGIRSQSLPVWHGQPVMALMIQTVLSKCITVPSQILILPARGCHRMQIRQSTFKL